MSGVSESDHVSEARGCTGCGGHNPPAKTVCEFCARPLRSTTAVQTASRNQPSSIVRVVVVLLGLAMVSVLLLNLAATLIVR
jgi:predicted amidophosphoribosyltransferase